MSASVLDEYEKYVKIVTTKFIHHGEVLQCSLDDILKLL